MSVSEFKFDPRSGDVTVERSNGQVDNFSLAAAVTRNSSGQLVGPDGQVVGGGVPAAGFGVRASASINDATTDYTDELQAWLNELSEGQTAVLPGDGWIRVGGDLVIPAGVDIVGSARLFSLNTNATIPTIRFSPSPSPRGRNTKLSRLRLFRILCDISEADSAEAATMADLIFDGVQSSGNIPGYYTATPGSPFKIGNRAFNIHFESAYRIHHWTGFGVDVQCTTEPDGSGSSRLATGVNIVLGGGGKLFNLGGNTELDGGGLGGGLRVIGAPQDGGTIQMQNGLLFDTCVSAIWQDNENQQTGAVAGDGRTMVLTGAGVRIERCGKLITDTAPYTTTRAVVFSRRGNLFLRGVHGLGFGANLAAGSRFFDIQGSAGHIDGIVTGVDNSHYLMHNDPDHSAYKEFSFDVVKSGGLVRGVSQPVYRRGPWTGVEAKLVFAIAKTGAAGSGSISVTLQTTDGQSVGFGELSNAAATGLTKGNTVSVGSGKTQISYTLAANGAGLTITLGDRQVVRVTDSYMRRNTLNSSVIIDGAAIGSSISLSFANHANAAADWISLADGGLCEFGVSVVSVAR